MRCRTTDPARLVTSSPGVANVLGDDAHNTAIDLLTPHTVRRSAGRPFWEVAPQQIAGLIERFRKPVLDDEPARNGPTQFGGIEGGTRPEWHIAAIEGTRAAGGYPIYHHDMFQYGYDSPLTPPSGIPEPDWSPFHRVVFDHLRRHRPHPRALSAGRRAPGRPGLRRPAPCAARAPSPAPSRLPGGRSAPCSARTGVAPDQALLGRARVEPEGVDRRPGDLRQIDPQRHRQGQVEQGERGVVGDGRPAC